MMYTAAQERAFARAKAQGVHVTAQGRRRDDGARVLVVNSGSEANKYYPVAIAGRTLVCGCAAGREGRYCKHRAAARRFLEEEVRNRPVTMWK